MRPGLLTACFPLDSMRLTAATPFSFQPVLMGTSPSTRCLTASICGCWPPEPLSAPYLSILREADVWRRFRKVVLIHAVRYAADLSYQAEINELKAQYPEQLIVQPFVSREPAALSLPGRIPLAIADGMLERHIGLPLNPRAKPDHALR